MIKFGEEVKGTAIKYKTLKGWIWGINVNSQYCDLCGRKLWVDPGGGLYCPFDYEGVHTIEQLEKVKRVPMKWEMPMFIERLRKLNTVVVLGKKLKELYDVDQVVEIRKKGTCEICGRSNSVWYFKHDPVGGLCDEHLLGQYGAENIFDIEETLHK